MNTSSLSFRRMVRAACLGQRRYGSRGRTDSSTTVTWSTPVEIVPGNAAPKVEGLGYWKTTFRNGANFCRTLYTPSNFRIVVGADWNA